jgi:hypothetical protein
VQHERRFHHHHRRGANCAHGAANVGQIMAYVACGEIVFDDLPEYPQDENSREANQVAYESDIWDGLTTQELIDLDLPF